MSEIILPGQTPKVETKTELVKPSQSIKVERSNHDLRAIGRLLEPLGFQHTGSFAAHIYINKDPHLQECSFILQSPIGDSHEVWCDLAWKGLRTRLSEIFGRTAPKKVKR